MWLGICFLHLFLQLLSSSTASREKIYPPDYGLCIRDQYLCINKKCLPRALHCNGVDDCGDNSDELFCKVKSETEMRPPHILRFACVQYFKDGPIKYIPQSWRCDGIIDCSSKRDEEFQCSTFSSPLLNAVESVNGTTGARKKAVNWLQSHRQNVSGNNRWGVHAPRIAVALYLADPNYFNGSNTTGNEIAYEIEIQVLVSLLRAETEPVSKNELALYIHALLVTCSDPRDFHGLNLVEKLRRQVDSERSYASPFVLLALCNVNDTMTSRDVDMLIHAFNLKGRTCWTSTQALSLMALSCIAKTSKHHNGPIVDSAILANMSSTLKQLQYKNGSFENMYTTGLVMQALFASETEDDGDWDMEEALKFLVKNQKTDGSYGNLLNTYFVLPVLYYNSLTNISTAHCPIKHTNDSVDTLEKLGFKIGKRMFVKYTLWFGDKHDLAYSMEIRVVENMTFFDVMKLAKALDNKYDFKYNLLDWKPYIYRLAGYQDDPEHEKFWFLYKANGTGLATTLINSSPIDVIPQNKEEYIMWYRSGHWMNDHQDLLEGPAEKLLILSEI